jgi:glycerol-3-phosphate dehydrogenase
MNDTRAFADQFDLAVIGGGINGCGIAADAAGRGLRVLLIEQGDLAGGTSSASSKLIHGGLRYLEHYEFRLVRESLEEREVLLANAPHIVWPLRFVVPHTPHMRSRLLMRAGLFLYDHLARRRRIPASGSVDMDRDPASRVLGPGITHAFHYSDCWVDDARLVVLVAKAAARRGARILTRTRAVAAIADDDRWRITIEAAGGGRREARARALVNAAGPWAGIVSREVIGGAARDGAGSPRSAGVSVRLVKGSHIVVPRIAGADDAFLLQADDGRVVFLLPFAGRFTLIGTTDVAYEGDPARAAISEAEENYLIGVANRFLAAPLARADIVWRFAGVRPLDDDASSDPSAVTRDYRLLLDAPAGVPPLLNVIGGKVTTYRRLAEAALGKLAPHLGRPLGPAWTVQAPLPGGDMAGADFAAYAQGFRDRRPGLGAELAMALLRRHGTLAEEVIGDAVTARDLGADLGGGLSEREVAYMAREEWARSAADVLWRRSKAGLLLSPAEREPAERRITEVLAAAGRAAGVAQ